MFGIQTKEGDGLVLPHPMFKYDRHTTIYNCPNCGSRHIAAVRRALVACDCEKLVGHDDDEPLIIDGRRYHRSTQSQFLLLDRLGTWSHRPCCP